MESDKSVYVVVAIFAFLLLVVGGLITFFLLDSVIAGVKENTKDSKPPALIVGLGRVLDKSSIGLVSDYTANIVYSEEIKENKIKDSKIGVDGQDRKNSVAVCGNGILEEGEECEGINGKCGYGKTCNCDLNCKSSLIQGPYCSDGIIQEEFGEGCDDGNLIIGDGCNSICKDEDITANEYCIDSDVTNEYPDGKNILTQGNVSTNKLGEIKIYEDLCDLQKTNVLEFYCLNGNVVSENINCSSGYECEEGKCIEKIVENKEIRFISSNIPDGAIDGRIPFDQNNTESTYGWSSIKFTFSENVEQLSIDNFSINGVGNAPPLKLLGIAQGSNQNEVVIIFDKQLSPKNRAIINYIPEDRDVCIGYLPGDVNGDGLKSSSDILDFIDALNDVKEFPIYSTDIDRSGTFNAADNLAFIDIGNGNYGNWNGQTLPPCKCTSDEQCFEGYSCSDGDCNEVLGSPYYKEESILGGIFMRL